MGTPNYVTPEIAKGEKYDEKCDVWSIGITLYVLLSCEAPYDVS